MSFNGKAYLAYEEARLEPDSFIQSGNYKQHTTSMAEKNKWYNSLTEADRERLRHEFELQYKNYDDDL
jgi:hypothetical protein